MKSLLYPTYHLIKSSFWFIYYRVHLGKETFLKKREFASGVAAHVRDASRGSFAQFYNIHGEQIRGWHKTSNREQNELIRKYS